MRRAILPLLFLLLTPAAALAQNAAPAAPSVTSSATVDATVDEAMRDVQRLLLSRGVEGAPPAELRRALAAWREALESDPATEVLAVAVAEVESRLLAEPFDEAGLAASLQALAPAMRDAAEGAAAAGSAGDEESLLVELASLIDQTADYIEAEGYTPRMEVEVP